MENIRGPTFGDFVTIRTEASMQDITVATRLQDYRVQEYRLPFPPLLNAIKCNVLRESLSVDSRNIRRIGNLCISLGRGIPVFQPGGPVLHYLGLNSCICINFIFLFVIQCIKRANVILGVKYINKSE